MEADEGPNVEKAVVVRVRIRRSQDEKRALVNLRRDRRRLAERPAGTRGYPPRPAVRREAGVVGHSRRQRANLKHEVVIRPADGEVEGSASADLDAAREGRAHVVERGGVQAASTENPPGRSTVNLGRPKTAVLMRSSSSVPAKPTRR